MKDGAVFPQSLNTEASKIQIINSIGAIIDNCLLLHSPNRLLIEIESIQKAEVHKKRNFLFNLFFIGCTVPLFYALYKNSFTRLEVLLMSVLIVILLGCGFFVKNSRYTLLIRKFDLDIIELEISLYCKEDAKKIASLINRKIRHMRKIK
jgi:hypothetical protein